MKSVAIIPFILTACSAIFFPLLNLPNRQSMMNICIYSVNPSQYRPKCFLCPSNVYSNVLRACVNAAAIPSNISYTQAACIEQNCMIGRGKRSVDQILLTNELEDNENRTPAEENEISPSDDKDILQDEKTSADLPKVFVASDDADYQEADDYEFEDS